MRKTKRGREKDGELFSFTKRPVIKITISWHKGGFRIVPEGHFPHTQRERFISQN